jgi:hypothetical protein
MQGGIRYGISNKRESVVHVLCNFLKKEMRDERFLLLKNPKTWRQSLVFSTPDCTCTYP